MPQWFEPFAGLLQSGYWGFVILALQLSFALGVLVFRALFR